MAQALIKANNNNGNEGQNETKTIESEIDLLKATIVSVMGNKIGMDLIKKIELNPIKYKDDDRLSISKYAQLMIKKSVNKYKNATFGDLCKNIETLEQEIKLLKQELSSKLHYRKWILAGKLKDLETIVNRYSPKEYEYGNSHTMGLGFIAPITVTTWNRGYRVIQKIVKPTEVILCLILISLQ